MLEDAGLFVQYIRDITNKEVVFLSLVACFIVSFIINLVAMGFVIRYFYKIYIKNKQIDKSIERAHVFSMTEETTPLQLCSPKTPGTFSYADKEDLEEAFNAKDIC